MLYFPIQRWLAANYDQLVTFKQLLAIIGHLFPDRDMIEPSLRVAFEKIVSNVIKAVRWCHTFIFFIYKYCYSLIIDKYVDYLSQGYIERVKRSRLLCGDRVATTYWCILFPGQMFLWEVSNRGRMSSNRKELLFSTDTACSVITPSYLFALRFLTTQCIIFLDNGLQEGKRDKNWFQFSIAMLANKAPNKCYTFTTVDCIARRNWMSG